MKIINRFTRETIFEYASTTMVETVKEAYLSGADLRGADLSGAYLSGAYLSGADLSGADLSGAYLIGAYLIGADLSGADLRGAYLRGADLRGADLRGADLRGAYLRGAYLSGAYLSGADLRGADLSAFKSDFFSVLMFAPNEIAALREKIVAGQVDGSIYEGECCCLLGTIANARHCKYTDLGALRPDAGRPVEQWFTTIRKGDTAEKSNVVKLTLEWLDEFVELAKAFCGVKEKAA